MAEEFTNFYMWDHQSEEEHKQLSSKKIQILSKHSSPLEEQWSPEKEADEVTSPYIDSLMEDEENYHQVKKLHTFKNLKKIFKKFVLFDKRTHGETA